MHIMYISWHPKTITIATSNSKQAQVGSWSWLITDHLKNYNNYEKVWNSVRIIKLWHSDKKWVNAVGIIVS